MENLVNQKLNEVTKHIKHHKSIDLTVEDSVKDYLIAKGFHPSLGVRPLKRLIQTKIVDFLSFAIINEGIPEGSRILLSYTEREDSWNIIWD